MKQLIKYILFIIGVAMLAVGIVANVYLVFPGILCMIVGGHK